MNTYQTSDGKRVTQSYIDYKIREAKRKLQQKFILEHGYRFCENCGCNGNGTILDWAHMISVDKCKKSGQSELAWNEDNIKSYCRDCHNEHDKNFIKQKSKK